MPFGYLRSELVSVFLGVSQPLPVLLPILPTGRGGGLDGVLRPGDAFVVSLYFLRIFQTLEMIISMKLIACYSEKKLIILLKCLGLTEKVQLFDEMSLPVQILETMTPPPLKPGLYTNQIKELTQTILFWRWNFIFVGNIFIIFSDFKAPPRFWHGLVLNENKTFLHPRNKISKAI